MTRHEPGVAGTASEIVVSAETRNPNPAATTAELTKALLDICRLEVTAEPAGPMVELAPGRYRFVLEPALDEFDERQLHGCLEDARQNHLQVDVRSLRRITSPSP